MQDRNGETPVNTTTQKQSFDAMRILVASREKEAVEAVRDILDQAGEWQITGRHISNGHVDPLYGLTELPNVLVLKVSGAWSDELEAVSSRPADQRPPLVVIAEASDSDAMRMAMRAGARDFLTKPVEPTELVEALRRITRDSAEHTCRKIIPGDYHG